MTGGSVAALVAFRAAVALDPTDAVSRTRLACSLPTTVTFQLQSPRSRESIRLDPGLAAAHFHLGLALERTGHANDAIGSYARALRLRADLVEAGMG